MARPYKEGLDYWPMDTDYYNDEKFQFIVAAHGFIAELVCVRIMAKIYRQGYYIRFNDDDRMLFTKNLNAGLTNDKIFEIVNEAMKRELFNAAMFQEYSILTSRGIQNRYLKAAIDSRRKNVSIDPKYSLLMHKPELTPTETELSHSFSTQRERERETERETETEKENESENEKLFHTLSGFEKTFFEDKTWFIDNASKVDNEPIELFNKAIEFCKHQKKVCKHWKDLPDMRNHFMNWIVSLDSKKVVYPIVKPVDVPKYDEYVRQQ